MRSFLFFFLFSLLNLASLTAAAKDSSCFRPLGYSFETKRYGIPEFADRLLKNCSAGQILTSNGCETGYHSLRCVDSVDAEPGDFTIASPLDSIHIADIGVSAVVRNPDGDSISLIHILPQKEGRQQLIPDLFSTISFLTYYDERPEPKTFKKLKRVFGLKLKIAYKVPADKLRSPSKPELFEIISDWEHVLKLHQVYDLPQVEKWGPLTNVYVVETM